MTTPKASGPLWAWANGEGGIDYEDVRKRKDGPECIPVRLIPGHGKVVPLELVEAIRKAYDNVCDAEDEDDCIDAHDVLARAFDAAVKGAI